MEVDRNQRQDKWKFNFKIFLSFIIILFRHIFLQQER